MVDNGSTPPAQGHERTPDTLARHGERSRDENTGGGGSGRIGEDNLGFIGMD